MASARLESGPWRGVLSTTNPFDDRIDDRLASATNVYFQDATVGGGVFARPGATNPVDVTGIAQGGLYSHVALDGTVYNFAFVGDASAGMKVYRWSAMGGSVVDVTPTNVVIVPTGTIYCTSLNNEMIVNDGVNKPWRATNLSSTPITATVIEQQTAANVLSRGSTDTALANTAFTFTRRAAPSLGTQDTQVASATGTAVGALGQIAANTWGVILVELTSAGVFTFTAAFNAGAGYASETLAIAALPARTVTRWYVGYVTVQADPGAVWIAGTDAFAGGATGNQAQTTNYYAGEGAAWSAFGRPVVYTGALFFVCNQVAATYARTTITWSEPNQPSVGYQQTDYDNAWTLTQTGSDPIYTLVATNDALLYAREASWSALGGAPGVNFQGTATHDLISGNIGCTNPGTTALFLNYVYFADQAGRPYRMPIGGVPEAIWRQAYTLFETAQVTSGVNGFGVIEPNLNVYLLVYIAPNAGARSVAVFDATTGVYGGLWSFGGDDVAYGAIMRDATTTASGNASLGLMMLSGGVSTPLWKLGTVYDGVWTDDGATMTVRAVTPKLGYSMREAYTFQRVRAILGKSSGTPDPTMAIATSQQSVSAAAGYVLASAPESPLYKVTWPLSSVTGRDIALTFAPTTTTTQFQLFGVEVDAVSADDLLDNY